MSFISNCQENFTEFCKIESERAPADQKTVKTFQNIKQCLIGYLSFKGRGIFNIHKTNFEWLNLTHLDITCLYHLGI